MFYRSTDQRRMAQECPDLVGGVVLVSMFSLRGAGMAHPRTQNVQVSSQQVRLDGVFYSSRHGSKTTGPEGLGQPESGVDSMALAWNFLSSLKF